MIRSTGLKKSIEIYTVDNTVNGDDSDNPFANLAALKLYLDTNTGFNTASGGATANTSDVTFTTATADWTTVTHHALMSAVSGGVMLWHGAVDTSKQIDNGDTAKYNAGSLDITLD